MRARLWSSPKTTSRTQCSWFSTPQWPRIFTFETNPKGVVDELIVDNRQARVQGTWSTGISAGFYGFDYRFKSRATGSGTAYLQFTPNILVAGEYEVYEWHVAAANRPIGAPHVIKFNGGTQTNTVDQQVNGAQWNLIGRFPFATGTNGYVRITDRFTEAGKSIMADAIKFTYVAPPTEFILDNPETTYSGPWTIATTAPDKYANYYQYAATVLGNSTAQATYTPNLGKSGKYNISIWYPQGTNRTSNAQILIAGNGNASVTSINQTTNGGAWRRIATETQFAAGNTGFVRLSNNTGESNRLLIADAVRFEFLEPAYLFSQPESQVAAVGSDVLFSIEARGFAPLKYQWKFNGVDVSGATGSSLVLTNINLAKGGEYSVVVTNVSGSVLSAPALLTIHTSNAAQFSSATLMGNSQIRLSLTGNAGATYKIDASTNLVNWVTMTNISSPDGLLEFIDSTSNSHRFYRATSP